MNYHQHRRCALDGFLVGFLVSAAAVLLSRYEQLPYVVAGVGFGIAAVATAIVVYHSARNHDEIADLQQEDAEAAYELMRECNVANERQVLDAVVKLQERLKERKQE